MTANPARGRSSACSSLACGSPGSLPFQRACSPAQVHIYIFPQVYVFRFPSMVCFAGNLGDFLARLVALLLSRLHAHSGCGLSSCVSLCVGLTLVLLHLLGVWSIAGLCLGAQSCSGPACVSGRSRLTTGQQGNLGSDLLSQAHTCTCGHAHTLGQQQKLRGGTSSLELGPSGHKAHSMRVSQEAARVQEGPCNRPPLL